MQEDAAGKLQYSVWLGSEAAVEQLTVLKQKAVKAAPGIPLQTADTNKPYLLKRLDVTASTTGTDGVIHFAAGVSGQTTRIHPKQQGITVKERSNRNYRGDLELSAYHDKLTLINVLPTEQYLYSVVGSELNSSWPAEALKAQAVAARTYAIKQGLKYEIAQVSDSTIDQAYYGLQSEFPAAIQAVDATKDEVILNKDGLIMPVFSSNAGGKTADPSEVWDNPASYLRSVYSPDQGAEAGKAKWYRIQLADGRTGYVHSLYLKDTGQKNAQGQPIFESTDENVNIRLAPYVDNNANPAIDQLALKQKVTVLDEEMESNAYSWIRGPYDADTLKSKLSAAGIAINGPLQSLEVSKRGPSGRVVEMKANGQVIEVEYPDAIRSLFGGLPSTLFEIEQAGSYTGNTASPADGASDAPAGAAIAGASETASAGDQMYVLSGSQSTPTAVKASDLVAVGATGQAKPLSQSGGTQTAAGSTPQPSSASSSVTLSGKQQIVFRGTGFGHGLGMSQWGAKGFAEQGYDYKKILQTYYTGVTITKE
ncbi:SpoIID/LytB domain-containing protein [Paenibacillus hexagrammi]|uniref:SpoIID/LytB domain-containing protein n=1 Tax=Paenibacillus hexagrammi TaxID=2908839 RepID=A0ABY3SDG1_9BACL|nr:SpoIID/LytB domain-containing protein [Paenibacillus sp. YPD9-1]UJF31976.1 SpoIID/LytB domain-containing protein [Paenibacillus sp. YPD9-1]